MRKILIIILSFNVLFGQSQTPCEFLFHSEHQLSAVDILNKSMEEFLKSGTLTQNTKLELKTILKFDDANLAYFLSLLEKAKKPKDKSTISLFDGTSQKSGVVAYTTAVAPPQLMSKIPVVKYETLKENQELKKLAANSTLWIRKMQAGTGSSMTRSTYLARILNLNLKDIEIGAKGTDLYLEVSGKLMALAQAQIMQSVIDVKRGNFKSIVLQDIVSQETRDSLEAIWKSPSLENPSVSNQELVASIPNISRFHESVQSYLPTLNEQREISLNRTAPGGHALFGCDALRAAFIDNLRPGNSKNLVAVIGNGEDLSSTPDPYMVGHILKNKIPIAMVTTTKTENDLKGGQIALVTTKDETYVTIVERAQADDIDLFEKLGLRPGDKISLFNTNMALFNYDVLVPMIKELVSKIGEDEFMRIIAPDLIENWKSQTDKDGVVRKYLQMEGAMASSLLNLDRYWRKNYHEPLVHFINVGKDDRTQFFAPIKSAFDYFMQFHSDRFLVDTLSMRLINKRPGSLPAVTLKDPTTSDKFYADVENVLNNFKNTSILNLDALNLEGQLDLSQLVLKGSVTIVNKTGKLMNVSEYLKDKGFKKDHQGRFILENQVLEIK